ncbi:MAG TPA: hypothetical protein VMN78_08315 [Longimicrobiales bacterium]|nr:hypothetical protein [Longimicrobiales bacterium]
MRSAAKRSLAAASAFMVVACGVDSTDPPTILEPSQARTESPSNPNKPGGGSDGDEGSSSTIPLDITIRDAPADGVQSDAAGAYHEGADGVEAVIMDNGNLSFALANSDTRRVLLDFGVFSWTGTLTKARVSTGDPSNGSGLTGLQVGETMLTRSQVTWVTDGKNWFLRYGRDCSGNGAGNDVDDNRVTVTRIADDTWSYATSDKDGVAPNAFLCSSNVRGRPGVSHEGEFHVPFGMTLMAQPRG